MAGYHKERFETECTECDRTIRTTATMRTRAPGAMIRCRECGHINYATKDVPHDSDERGQFTGAFL